MAEQVDAGDLKSPDRNVVPVRSRLVVLGGGCNTFHHINNNFVLDWVKG